MLCSLHCLTSNECECSHTGLPPPSFSPPLPNCHGRLQEMEPLTTGTGAPSGDVTTTTGQEERRRGEESQTSPDNFSPINCPAPGPATALWPRHPDGGTLGTVSLLTLCAGSRPDTCTRSHCLHSSHLLCWVFMNRGKIVRSRHPRHCPRPGGDP